jgi:hypothetical protein
MSRKNENKGFICEKCKKEVLPLTNGSYRNHCPFCMYLKHVDIVPGDRKNQCGGLMKPAGLIYKSGKGYQVIHRCVKCGVERRNIIAANTEQTDDVDVIIALFV